MTKPAIYDLTGRVAFVTGGSRGIGAAIVERLAGCGAKVAFTYVTSEAAAKALEEKVTAAGGIAKACLCDVRSRETVRKTMADVAAQYGGLDILVNNAGINRRKDFEDTTDEDWDAVMETNLKAPFICAQEALSYLKKSSQARIINMSSISAQIAGPRTVHYAVSKSGLDCLTHFLGRYCGPFNIAVNSINPNVVLTDMAKDLETSPEGQVFLNETPMHRFGTLDDVANATAFLASGDSGYVTGHLLHLNGGRYLG
jgi:3-oxoacyl-[acyl-carrier protein] reductase